MSSVFFRMFRSLTFFIINVNIFTLTLGFPMVERQTISPAPINWSPSFRIVAVSAYPNFNGLLNKLDDFHLAL
jgi:hypothetical protein